MHMKQIFTADNAGIGKATEFIRKTLDKGGIKGKANSKAVLEAEESMGELVAHVKEGSDLWRKDYYSLPDHNYHCNNHRNRSILHFSSRGSCDGSELHSGCFCINIPGKRHFCLGFL